MQTTITRPTRILKQILPDGQPPKYIRCPSCLQLKPAAFVDVSTKKEYCSDCAYKFKEKTGVILFYPDDKSVESRNRDNELKRLTPQQKAFLEATNDDISIKFKVNYIHLAAKKVGESPEWGIENVNLLRDEGFYVPSRSERRSAFIDYVVQKIKTNTTKDPREITAAIAQETHCDPKNLRPLVREIVNNPDYKYVSAEISLTQRIKSLLHPGKSLSLTEIQCQIGTEIPRSSIKSACDRLINKGVIVVEKQRHVNYFRLL